MVLTTIYMVHKELHGAMVEIDIEEVRTKNPDGTGFADDDGRESLVVQGMYMPRFWCRCGGDRLLTRARCIICVGCASLYFSLRKGASPTEIKIKLSKKTGVPIESQKLLVTGVGQLWMGDKRSNIKYARRPPRVFHYGQTQLAEFLETTSALTSRSFSLTMCA